MIYRIYLDKLQEKIAEGLFTLVPLTLKLLKLKYHHFASSLEVQMTLSLEGLLLT